MASLNKVFLIGNLTRPPELRYTPSGTAVADLRLAVNRNYTTQGGEKREETSFITVVVWGKQAETCGDRKSTRLNSSHTVISYAVFCLKKKKKKQNNIKSK